MKKSFWTGRVLTRYLLAGICWMSGNATLQAEIPSGYYDGASGKSGAELKAALHDIISDHTKYPYTSSNTDVWDILKAADEDPDNSNNVILIYTGRSQAKTENSGESSASGSNRWNREHIWAKSHGFPNESDTAYTDCHHLRPADESVNSSRNNRDFDNGGVAHSEADSCNYSDDNWTWEPRDAVKGDVARSMFYMVVRYDPGYHTDASTYDLELVDSLGTQTGEPLFGKLSTLLDWHAADPVDSYERNRNDVIYSYQGNRNPFIDHPEYADSIWNAALPAPTNLTSANVRETSLDLSWSDNAGDESGYYLYQDASRIKTLAANTTSTSVSGLSAGTTYTFKVSAYRTSKESGKTSLNVTTSRAGDLILTGVYDGPLSGGLPKGVELFVLHDIADLSVYGLGSANNGGGSDGQEYTFPAVAVSSGSYLYVASESSGFSDWFGSAPDYTSGSMSINGDDAIELFYNGSAIDIYGDVNVDGNGESWEYLDGWAYSNNDRSVTTSFNSSDWSYSGANAWDDDASKTNATATPSFPAGTFSSSDQSLPVVLSAWQAISDGGYVMLTWTTESEIENQGFIIERRNSKFETGNLKQIVSFATNDALLGHGSTTARNSYTYTDKSVDVDQTYTYQLSDVDYHGKVTKHGEISITVTVQEEDLKLTDMQLLAVYPNPFNPVVNVSFTLVKAETASLEVYNLQGERLQILANGYQDKGMHDYNWCGLDASGHLVVSGIYLVRLVTDTGVQVQRITLLR